MRILITGANGYLGGLLAAEILRETDFDVLAAAASEEKVTDMAERTGADRSRIRFLSNEDLLKPETRLDGVYGAVHLAFARRTRPAAETASSLTFAAGVFRKLAERGVERVVNVSSQGVYGSAEEIRTENTPPAPDNPYTMAKYASEILFEEILKDCPLHTSLRLDPVTQSQNVVRGLCRSAAEGLIRLRGGKQVFSFIDGEDAVKAFAAMLKADGGWESVYNAGWNRKRYTLTELADAVADAAERCGRERPEIRLEEEDIRLWAGMDSSRFMDKTGWKPEIPLRETVEKMMRELL